MTQTIIEKPIINSPFVEPMRHFRFADEGITNEIVDSRRISSYFVPIASPKKGKGAGQQLAFGTYLLFLTRNYIIWQCSHKRNNARRLSWARHRSVFVSSRAG